MAPSTLNCNTLKFHKILIYKEKLVQQNAIKIMKMSQKCHRLKHYNEDLLYTCKFLLSFNVK